MCEPPPCNRICDNGYICQGDNCVRGNETETGETNNNMSNDSDGNNNFAPLLHLKHQNQVKLTKVQ